MHDAPNGTEAARQFSRLVMVHDVENTTDLHRLRAEHAELTAQVAALAHPLVLPPRVIVPLLAVPVDCSRCDALAAEFKAFREALQRERALALKTADAERAKRLRLEAYLAEARIIIASLRRGVRPLDKFRTGNPRRYGQAP